MTKTFIDIAEKCIPKTSTNYKRNKPWFNEEVKTAIKKRKTALRTFNKCPTEENLIYTKEMRAKARRTIKTSKRTPWKQYVSNLNSRTPAQKVWDMIRKISGKSKTNKLIHLKSSNGKMNTSKKEISNVLGENFQQNSSCSNYSETFQNIKQEKEKEKLDFASLNQEKYNLPFHFIELSEALKNLMIQLLVMIKLMLKLLNIYLTNH